MKPIDIQALERGFRGRPYRSLIQHHLDKQPARKRELGLRGTLQMLPPTIGPVAEKLIDRWNVKAYDPEFWTLDCADVFRQIIADAETGVKAVGEDASDELLFNLFNIITLNFAVAASAQPKMQVFIGVKARRFPIWSLLMLAYPLSAMIYAARVDGPITSSEIIGYGLSNLGYLLLGAGLVVGSFRILGLRNRAVTLAVGVGAWILGVSLSM